MLTNNQVDSIYDHIDQLSGQKKFIKILEEQALFPPFLNHRRLCFEKMNVSSGATLLDVGCGIGSHTFELAKFVGDHGCVFGVDRSHFFIDEAQKRKKIIKSNTEFQTGDIYNLPFQDNLFDGCYCERVLMHLANPEQALREMIRVIKPGGVIAITEPDLNGVNIYPINCYFSNHLITDFACKASRNPYIGAELTTRIPDLMCTEAMVLPFLLVVNKLNLVSLVFDIDAIVEKLVHLNQIRKEEAQAYLKLIKKEDQANKFFCYAPFFSIIATKS
jgi:ubiquinone/menaquinone biosynthesis C-methylase UbiE